jgi:hypothetical protein
MNFRKPTSRWPLWVFAAALLLQAAMPMLASASAESQGKTLVEVCTVYGVSMVPLGNASEDHVPPHDHFSDHGNEHCALSALGAFAALEPPIIAPVRAPLNEAAPPFASDPTHARDACAAWFSRLKHGPPALA